MDNALPGPRQVVTDPGASGIDPVTGQRQRRRGVSGVPTSASVDLPECADPSPSGSKNAAEAEDKDGNVVEFEIDAEDVRKLRDRGEDEETDPLARCRRIVQPAVLRVFKGNRNARSSSIFFLSHDRLAKSLISYS